MNDFARQILRLVLIIAIDVIIIYSISKTIGKAIARKKEKEELIKSIERYGLNANGYADPEYIKKMIGIKRKYAYLKKKVDAGVTHLNTQLFFDNEDFFRFSDMLALAGIDVPVQAGIMPLVKKSHVDRIISLSGAKIPAKISRMISKFYDKPDALMEAGIAYATSQIIDLLSAGARGVHLYVMNNAYVAEKITANVSHILGEINKK